MPRAKAAAWAVAFVSLVGIVGGAAFAIAREDAPAPTTTTTSTVAAPTRAELATAIAAALTQGLDVPLTEEQAACVAAAFLDVVGEADAVALVDAPTPLGAVSVAQRDAIVQGIVGCVPPEIAGALLGTPTTLTTVPPQLPDEDVADG